MNTKHRILSVFLILAMVTTLCVVMAVPASAAVTAITVVPTDPAESAVSAYTITYTTAAAYVDNDITTVTFPVGTVTTGMVIGNISLTGPAGAVAIDTLVVVGTTGFSFLNNASPSAAGTYTLAVAAVVTNPVAGTAYTATVVTASDAIGTSAAYTITNAVSAVNFVAAPTTANTAAIHTITFNAGTALTAGLDQITVRFPATATVPATIAKTNIAVAGAAGAAVFKPLLTTDPDPAVSGQSVTVLIPLACGNSAIGQAYTVKIYASAGILNPYSTSALANIGYVSTTGQIVPKASTTYSAISSSLVFTPTTTTTNGVITAIGKGFTPNTSVDLGGGAAGSGTVDATGNFTITGVAVAAAVVTATDGAGVFVTSGIAPTLIAAATVAPASGLTGSTVVVSATGLTGATSYALGVSGTQVAVLSATVGTLNTVPAPDEVTTNALGAFTCVIRIPSGSTAGAKVINVRATTFAGVDLAAGSFSVDARTLTASVSNGFKGDTVVLNGAGFEPASAGRVVTANVTFTDATGGVSANLLTTAASVSAAGTFQATVAVPAQTALAAAIAAGTGRFTATASINGVAPATPSRATAVFTINAATVTVSPTSGVAGSQIDVTFAGLGAYLSYNSVTIDGATVINFGQSAVTDANGNLTASFVWPGLAAGAHTFILTGVATPVASFTQTAGSVTIASGLNTVAGKYTKVWAFDATTQEWTLYDTAEGATSTLSAMQRGQGYWIQATEDATIIYGGNTYALSTGWNLIGWLG